MWKSWTEKARLKKPRTLLLLAALAGGAAIWACGPDLDYDTSPHRAGQTSWLARMLATETRKPGQAKAVAALAPDENIRRTEALLKDALGNTPDSARVLTQWRAFRGALLSAESRNTVTERSDGGEQSPPPATPLSQLTVPAGLPPAFALYEQGALAWHNGKASEALPHWEDVLKLPDATRKYRAVNAAYMLGRATLKDPETCAKHMAQCRALAAAGCPDPEGLAAASWGWEARGWLDAKAYEKAIPLYFTQASTGDPGAMVSLSMAVSRLLKENTAVIARAAGNDQVRPIVSALLVNRSRNDGRGTYWGAFNGAGSPTDAARWMDALEASGAAAKADAAPLAWLAYQAGNYPRAAQWAKDSPSPMCAWIRAKMAQRAGNPELAARELENAIQGFATDNAWQGASLGESPAAAPDAVRLELAELRLAQGDFTRALTLFYDGGGNERADYLADRILTTDELKAWVRAHPGLRLGYPVKKVRQTEAAAHGAGAAASQCEEVWWNVDLAWLLARRLVREGKYAEARPFFPLKMQPVLDRYVAALQAAEDPAGTPARHAEALWQAAVIERHEGMELMGSQAGPDEFRFDGRFGGWDNGPSADDPLSAQAGGRFHSKAEKDRFTQSAILPNQRFHYRYLALNHAWAACALMDDDTDLLAARLREAGLWVADRNPKAADRFYKALVTRCGHTDLGRDADRRRWFPPNPPGQAQPAITKQPPTQAQVWRARVKGHAGLLTVVGVGMIGVVATGVWGWRKKRMKSRGTG